MKIKSIIAIICLAMLLSSCGANGQQPKSSSEPQSLQSEQSQSQSVASVSTPEVKPSTSEDIISKINNMLKENGAEEPAFFEDGYTCEIFEDVTVYRKSGYMGYNTIVLYLTKSNSYQVLDLAPYASHKIIYVSQEHENLDILQISAESVTFGGDYRYKDYNCDIFYSISKNEITCVDRKPYSGTYGMVGTYDTQRFANCSIEGNTAVLRFEVAPDSQGNHYAGPQVIIAAPYLYEDENTASFGFCDTELNVASDFIDKMRKMNGVASVDFKYLDEGMFKGTQLVIKPKDGYTVNTYFNRSGELYIMEDFNIECLPNLEK